VSCQSHKLNIVHCECGTRNHLLRFIMKACSKCKENKFINDFPKRFDNGKLRNECFVCISEYKKENKLKNKAKIA